MKKIIKFSILTLFFTANITYASNIFYSDEINNYTHKDIKNKKTSQEKYTIEQLLKKWSSYHKEFYGENYVFILDPKINTNVYISKQQVDILIKQDLNTLKTFLENKIGINLNFKIIRAGNVKICNIVPQQKLDSFYKQQKVNKIIKKLNEINEEAKNLKNFDYRTFHKELKKIILKIKTYEEIEN